MRTFEYKGFDSSGSAQRGLIEATDVKEARERLATRGVMAEHVTPAGAERPGLRRGGRPAFGGDLRVFFYRELGVLLGAGLPLVNALDLLILSPELGGATTLLAAVRDRVREGASLAQALGQSSPAVTGFERAIVEVGERSGSLDAILERLASFLDEQLRLREKIIAAMTYPCIVFVFAMLIATVMLGFVIPSAARLLMEQTHAPLPLLTRGMMAAGRVLRWLVPVAAVGGTMAFIYLRRRLRRDAALAQRLDRWIFRLPLVGRGYALVVNLRCARTLAILLRGGVSLIEALPLAGRATGSAWVGGRLTVEAEAVRHGSSLADAMRRVPILSASLPAWIQAGEASGALETLLDTAGNSYQHQWERFVTRTLSLLEPALIALIGAFVLLVALSVLLPILSLNRAIG